MSSMLEMQEPGEASTRRASAHSETKRHIRGSSLLLTGRLFGLVANFGVQVLIVRYLAKADYGAFAYAMSIVSMGAHIAQLGLARAVVRFVPIFQERKDYPSMYGTIVFALGTVAGIGLALIVLTLGLQGVLAQAVINDPVSLGLLLILISLTPLQALDGLFEDLLAVLAKPGMIFYRRYILTPCLKLAAILVVMAVRGDVQLLAYWHLLTGGVGVAIYVWMAYHILKRKGLWAHFNLRHLQVRARQLLAYSVPLMTTDLVLIVKTTVAVLLLEYFHGTEQVAEFRAVLPVAGLSLIVLQSFKMLFMPAASRLFARDDVNGISEMYWNTAVWTTLVTFPIFGTCFLLAKPVTVLLFEERYASSAVLLAWLAVANYFNAAMGLNAYTLYVYARVRYVVFVNVATAAVALVLDLLLIPRLGALGAAIAMAAALVTQNLLNHAGLLTRTPVRVFDRRYVRVYAGIIVATVVLYWIQRWWQPPLPVGVALLALASLALLHFNQNALALGSFFPELERIPLLRRALGRGSPRPV